MALKIPSSDVLDRVLVLEMVRVTEAAAIAASKLIGRGDEKAADAAAVEAMRAALNELAMDGTVVIGEGERDEAPMLYIGEKVGSARGTGPKIDIALDPLEGTTITAKAGPNALAVLAIAEEGNLLNAPDVYMDKLAVGPGYPKGVIDLNKSPTENVHAVAKAKGVAADEIIVCVLDRPRHAELIAELRAIGCGIQLIPDGDVAGVIATTNADTTIDLYMARAGRRKGCSRRRHCAASAASSRAGCCSAMTTSAVAPANGASPTSTRSTSWRSSRAATASSPPPASPTARCSRASSGARAA
jgi:fructose-1,6-bisphosphatase II / sedoheptulose-1,7-bisphosphatase